MTAGHLLDNVELLLLRSIVERKETCRQAAILITPFIVDVCAKEIESLDGDNEDFHADGLRERLIAK